MKVKVFSFYGARAIPYQQRIEGDIQNWLNDNPNVSTEHVAQSGGQFSEVWVTIFYRD
jgi:hypothetical protein